uniref:Annexin n=1 Tax=Heterodera glycines TaxID=51029 RepID=A0A7D6HMD2_HETGL|nr:annexin [Heterodera glycines]
MLQNGLTILLLISVVIGHSLANLGPTIKHNPHFKAVQTAHHLHDAIAKKHEAEVTQVICSISNEQRQALALEFKKQFGTDLIAMLKKEFKSDFEELIISLMQTPAVYDANQMRAALSGSNEAVLIEILATRTNRQITALKQAYEQLDRRHQHNQLEEDIKAKTKGPFQNLLVSLLSCSREESAPASIVLAHDEAMKLFREGEGRRGVNAVVFNQVLATRSFAQLRETFEFYRQAAHHEIEEGIKQEFSGHNEAGFLALIKYVRNASVFFADLLFNSMKGLGTRDSDLIRLVISRSEIDLADIKHAFHTLHKKSLEEAIKGDTSGAYRDALLALVKGNTEQ